MRSQAEKAAAFRRLHERDGAFIIPNPWDAGTAWLLAQIGFEVLATTSAGYAFSVGKRDGEIGRDEMIKHVGDIASATDLPVSADLENGFSDDPESVAETIRLGRVRPAARGCLPRAGRMIARSLTTDEKGFSMPPIPGGAARDVRAEPDPLGRLRRGDDRGMDTREGRRAIAAREATEDGGGAPVTQAPRPKEAR